MANQISIAKLAISRIERDRYMMSSEELAEAVAREGVKLGLLYAADRIKQRSAEFYSTNDEAMMRGLETELRYEAAEL